MFLFFYNKPGLFAERHGPGREHQGRDHGGRFPLPGSLLPAVPRLALRAPPSRRLAGRARGRDDLPFRGGGIANPSVSAVCCYFAVVAVVLCYCTPTTAVTTTLLLPLLLLYDYHYFYHR